MSGWRVTPDNRWDLLGKRNPTGAINNFWPVADNTMVLRKNDTLAARCTFVSSHLDWFSLRKFAQTKSDLGK